MKTLIITTTLALTLSSVANAQTPAGAPRGATAQCKDGTWSSEQNRDAACSDRDGVRTWYGASDSPTNTPAPAMMPPQTFPKPTPQTMPNAATPTTGTQMGSRPTLPGGMSRKSGAGTGKVWVNQNSRTYLCEGERGYGTAAGGAYMSETDAIAADNQPANGAKCAR
jgi:uncharacterized protein DUF3761